MMNVKMWKCCQYPMPISNWKLATLALATLATMATFAKTFDVDISTGRPAASNEAYYHGETIEFRAVRGRTVVTNIEYSCVYYQTNGMDSVWWNTDGLTFHPTNDVGAASYRFFLEGRDDLGRDWHANGLLRLLPSPGFEPSVVELPVKTLDFATVEVLNAPYYTKAETEQKIVELSPGNYAAVSNAAMNAVSRAEVEVGWWGKWVVLCNGTNVTAQVPQPERYFSDVVGWSVPITYPTASFGDTIWDDETGYNEDTSLLEWTSRAGTWNATRRRVAAPVPTVPEDIGAASTNDVNMVLGFSHWTILRNGEDVSTESPQPEYTDVGYDWNAPISINGTWGYYVSAEGSQNATSLSWTGAEWNLPDDHYIATRSYGYILGSQPYKALQPAGDYASVGDIPPAVTNIVKGLSLGGIWDSGLEVWWTPVMHNGSLTYQATTNVNLNAEH